MLSSRLIFGPKLLLCLIMKSFCIDSENSFNIAYPGDPNPYIERFSPNKLSMLYTDANNGPGKILMYDDSPLQSSQNSEDQSISNSGNALYKIKFKKIKESKEKKKNTFLNTITLGIPLISLLIYDDSMYKSVMLILFLIRIISHLGFKSFKTLYSHLVPYSLLYSYFMILINYLPAFLASLIALVESIFEKTISHAPELCAETSLFGCFLKLEYLQAIHNFLIVENLHFFLAVVVVYALIPSSKIKKTPFGNSFVLFGIIFYLFVFYHDLIVTSDSHIISIISQIVAKPVNLCLILLDPHAYYTSIVSFCYYFLWSFSIYLFVSPISKGLTNSKLQVFD